MPEFDPRRYRTFSRRVLAGFVDGLVFLPLYWVNEWILATDLSWVIASWFVLDSFSYYLYSVLLHGFFGQTLGKRLMQVRVLDLSGGKLSMRQALLRDSVGIVLAAYLVVRELPQVLAGQKPYASAETGVVDDVFLYFSLGWFVLEIVTMLFNRKRRAVHDFIAGSVVLRTDILLSDRAPRPA